ncbi:MAG: hypothetical protein K2M04_02880 [Muribaculaceae bacterium]|nr:hypothetical protein [Muribaculaceae bacterium]
MFQDINHLLTTAYELEGLLTLARDRGNETPKRVYDQIKAKIGILNAAITPASEAAAETAQTEATAQPVESKQEAAYAETAVGEDKPNIETQKPEAPEAEAEEVTSEAEEEVTATEDEAETESTETEEKEAESAETEEWEDSEPDPKDGPEDLNRLDMQQAEEDEADSEATEADEWESHHSEEVSEMKIDGAKLRKYFTLNDRFRYRRELFGGSDVAYKAGIALIASMKSIDDVKHYLTFDLGLAADSQEVADFIELVTPYFQSKQ